MKLHTLVFSPTGTSAKIARAVVDGILKAEACETSLLDGTKRAVSSTFEPEDLVVMAAPVYGGKMAPIAKERFRQVSAQATPCVLLAVYGNRAFENALNDMAGFAESLGLMPIAAGAFIGEHSYSTPQTPIAAKRPDAADLKAAEEFGQAIAQKLKNGKPLPIDTASLHDEPSPETSLQNFRTFVMNYQQEQKVHPKQYLPEVDARLCTGCGTCAESCPTAAISQDGRQTEAAPCIKCCACVKVCPVGARSLFTPFAAVLSKNFNTRKSPVRLV